MYDDVTLKGVTYYRVYALYMTIPIICMHVCVCTIVCMYHTYVCMYVCMLYSVYAYRCVCVCVCGWMCVCIYTHTYVRTYTQVHVCTYVYTYACMHVCTYTYIQAITSAISIGTADVRACRSLHCAPAIVKERALGGIPDCFRGIVWQKLTAADALRHRYPDR